MTIVQVPHPSLRRQTQPVSVVTAEFEHFLNELGSSLVNHRHPRGVGLAAPQVDRNWQVFATYLPTDPDNEKSPPALSFCINPEIVRHSPHHTLGSDPEQPVLEGCLSIPKLYGPVPRWEWIELEYEQLTSAGQLERRKQRFGDFHARVVQHELDHLHGVLFTDYSLKYQLPIYQEQGKKLVEIDPRVLLAF